MSDTRVIEALRDLVAWADEQQAMTGAEAVASLMLRIERARRAVSALEHGGGATHIKTDALLWVRDYSSDPEARYRAASALSEPEEPKQP